MNADKMIIKKVTKAQKEILMNQRKDEEQGNPYVHGYKILQTPMDEIRILNKYFQNLCKLIHDGYIEIFEVVEDERGPWARVRLTEKGRAAIA